MCISPISIRNPKYNSAKIRMEVPCGKCPECLERRRADWSLRLSYESRRHINSQFITLTYEDDHMVYGARSPTLVKADLQLFFKRLRKRLIDSKLKYYAIGEYGTNTYRPHYHIILFGLDHSHVHRGILENAGQRVLSKSAQLTEVLFIIALSITQIGLITQMARYLLLLL